MATGATRKRTAPRERRVPRTFRLPIAKLRAAKRALGAAATTEAIERALDLVIFQHGLIKGARAMRGVSIMSPDPER
jgi:hypothetical protein